MKGEHLIIEHFVFVCYKRDCYKAYYAPIIYPFNEETLWIKTKFDDLQPPSIRRQPESPRRRGAMRQEKW